MGAAARSAQCYPPSASPGVPVTDPCGGSFPGFLQGYSGMWKIQLTRTRFARPKGGHRAGSGAQIRRRRTRLTRRNFQQSKSPPARRVDRADRFMYDARLLVCSSLVLISSSAVVRCAPALAAVLAFHLLILRLCWQRLAPEHSWHSLLRRLCENCAHSQIRPAALLAPAPLPLVLTDARPSDSLHSLLCRLCSLHRPNALCDVMGE